MMHLVKAPVVLVATKLADALIRAGQMIHARWAVVPDPPRERARADRWRQHVQSFALWAAPLNFSQRKVIGAGIVGRRGYETYMRLMRAAGVIVVYPRSGAAWAYGWDRRKFSALVRRGLVDLPYPISEDPPPLFETRAADTQLAHYRQLTQVSTWAATAPAARLKPAKGK
jgi:hypothetical protein